MCDANDVYAVALLKSWFQKQEGVFDNHKMKSEFKDAGNGSASVRLESARYLAEICVWDHASCMDVEILEVHTEKSTFQHVGECKTRFEFEGELSKFLDWLKSDDRISI